MPTWSAQQLKPWLETLHNNHVAAAPAEGVYGYVANPFSEDALAAVMEIKKRNSNKGLIVLIANLGQLGQFCPLPLPKPCAQAVSTLWPAPATTLILPALPSLSPLLTGGKPTIAIRLVTNAYMLEYLNAFGAPLVSTSLNLAGLPAATTAQQIPPLTPALTLPQPLSGTPSRLYNPLADSWLR